MPMSLGGQKGNVIIIDGDEKRSLFAGSSRFSSGRGNSLIAELLRRDGGRSTGNDDEDMGDGDEEIEEDSNELAARTLTTIKWLYDQGRLTKNEKDSLTIDVIECAGSSKFSQAEVAFALFICGGRPAEDILDIPEADFDVSSLDLDDLLEFENIVRTVSKN